MGIRVDIILYKILLYDKECKIVNLLVKVLPTIRAQHIRELGGLLLDIYSSIILGLPGLIDLTCVDQLKPSGLSRDYFNEENGGFASITRRRMAAACVRSSRANHFAGSNTDREAGSVKRKSLAGISLRNSLSTPGYRP
jgi:hypothetical protein